MDFQCWNLREVHQVSSEGLLNSLAGNKIMKNLTIQRLKDADISQDGWEDLIINGLPDRYAAGYLQRYTETMDEALGRDEEEFREELIHVCENFNIWNQ